MTLRGHVQCVSERSGCKNFSSDVSFDCQCVLSSLFLPYSAATFPNFRRHRSKASHSDARDFIDVISCSRHQCMLVYLLCVQDRNRNRYARQTSEHSQVFSAERYWGAEELGINFGCLILLINEESDIGSVTV